MLLQNRNKIVLSDEFYEKFFLMTMLNVSNVVLDAITCVMNFVEIVVINDRFHREYNNTHTIECV
jgi:hypothetical protein